MREHSRYHFKGIPGAFPADPLGVETVCYEFDTEAEMNKSGLLSDKRRTSCYTSNGKFYVAGHFTETYQNGGIIMNESEKKLLKAIFENEPQDENEGLPDNYPDTDADKIGYAAYAAYVVTKSLEYISPALQRLYRCEALCKLSPPNIITNNESRMALEHLSKVKRDIDDAYNEVLTVYKRTKDYSQPIEEANQL